MYPVRHQMDKELFSPSIIPEVDLYCKDMKPLPAPSVPGDTDTQRFDNAVRKMFTVSKEEMQQWEAEWHRLQSKKHPKKP
jgi:hypothetical protein